MTLINPVLYRKLMAQAEEAKEQGMTKLADSIMQAIGTDPNSDVEEYSYFQLRDDVNVEAWKLASHVMRYYNLESVDAEQLQKTILVAASNMVNEIERTLDVESVVVGPLEPKVPGENK